MAHRLLVLVPHEQMHAPRSILEQVKKLDSVLTEIQSRLSMGLKSKLH